MARVADTKLYDVLNLKPSATDNDIKKAFKKLAKEHNPERNNKATGDKWDEIKQAYDVLSDPHKRKLYNNYGEGAVQEIEEDDDDEDDFGPGGGMHGSLFSNLFGMGGRRGGGRPRGQDVHHVLRVSLKDLYLGKTKQLQLTKKVMCSSCKGLGGRQGAVQTCSTCRGRGIQITVHQLAPGMVQQMQSACSACSGQGEIIDPKHKCKKCNGEKVVQEVKVLEVNVKKGMKRGTKIPFRGEGDQMPGVQPGDVIIVIDEKEDDNFKRIDDDLYVEYKIGLAEALCGFKMTVQHLDGRVLLLKYPPGQVIQPDSFLGVWGEGMPKARKSAEKGNLYVKFEIEFPDSYWVDEEKIKELEGLLPPQTKEEIMETEDVEEVHLMDFASTRGETDHSTLGEAYDDDTDHHHHRGHGPAMGCSQQ